MSILQGPERKDQPQSSNAPIPQTKTGEMGDRQVVCYDPRMAHPFSLENISRVFQEKNSQWLHKSLEEQKYITQHLHQYGEGKIFVLLGHSTAGKTSIIQQLKKEHPEWTESGMDLDFPSQDADEVRTKEPALYTKMALAMEHADIGRALQGDKVYWKPNIPEEIRKDAREALEIAKKIGFDAPSQDANTVKKMEPALYARMARALEHCDIAIAIFGHDDQPNWKSNVPADVLKDAELALESAKKKKDEFPLSYTIKDRKMEESVIERAMHGKSVIFDPYDEKAFLAHMIEKNNFAPLKMGLAYCPFSVLAERVKKRNIDAIASGRMDDYRPALQPLKQFCDFIEPAKPRIPGKQAGDTTIDTLLRDEVDKAFEDAFQQDINFLQKGISEGDQQSIKETAQLHRDHDAMKQDIMDKLGFRPGVSEVNLTTKRNKVDYVFNTNIMKPPASTAIIHEWL